MLFLKTIILFVVGSVICTGNCGKKPSNNPMEQICDEDPMQTSLHEIRSHVDKIQTSITIIEKIVSMVDKYLSTINSLEKSKKNILDSITIEENYI